MSKKNANIEYEITPASTKGKVELPSDGTNELMKASARLIDSLRTGSEKVGNMFLNSISTIGKPISALIEGKTAEIELANQFITANLILAKEINATTHMSYVAQEFNEKVKNNEKIPDKIEKSDNLYAIQDKASEVSNEEFLKLWAKLYTEEACNPGTVSKKTINILSSIDANMINILENLIFPYCDSNGFYWMCDNCDITHVILAQDYGFIDNKSIVKYFKNPETANRIMLNPTNILYVYPGFGYCPKDKYVLTKSGLEIKNILKIFPKQKHIKTMIKAIEESAQYWRTSSAYNIKIKKTPNSKQKFIICNKNNKVKYPKDSKFKTLKEFEKNAQENIEVKHAK